MDETIVVGVINHAGALTIVKDKKTGKELLEGMVGNFDYGEYGNQLIYEHFSFQDRFNVSIKLHREYNRNSDGLNDLINGSVDIFLYSEDLSLAREHPESLLSLPIVETVQPILITPYDCSLERSINESYRTDILESVTGFLPDVWIVTLFSLVIIAMLINIHMKMNQVSKPWMSPNGGFWTIISFLLKNPSMIEVNWVSSILGTLVAISVFFVSKCYFENVIKSDQISIYQPTVYTSYAMVVDDPGIHVAVASVRIADVWKQEPPHSKYRKIFDDNFKKHGMDKISKIETFNWFFSTPRDKKATIYLTEPGFATSICNWKEYGLENWNFDGLCFYEHVPQFGDPEKDDIEILIENKANLISLAFTRKKIFRRFLKCYIRSYEIGVYREGMMRQKMKQITPSIADCVPQKPPVTHDPGSLPFDLYNYKFSFALIVLLYSIALFILIYEVRHHRRHSSGNISHNVTEISVQWKRSNENQPSSTVPTMECRDDIVEKSIQSVANKKSKATDVKTTLYSKIEIHQSKIYTVESNAIETNYIETSPTKTDTIKTSPTRSNHSEKIVTHVDVDNSPSTSQRVSSGKKVEKKFGSNRIFPVFDDRILTEETQTCKRTDTVGTSSIQSGTTEARFNRTEKKVTHFNVLNNISRRDQRVSIGKKNIGRNRNRIVPVSDDKY